ncbi:single-stranded DNA-binding protein [Myxosarcina sp. GI1(2024)]
MLTTATISGKIISAQEQGKMLLCELEVEAGKLPVLLEVYGKKINEVKEMLELYVIATGDFDMVNKTGVINVDDISPVSPETKISQLSVVGYLSKKPTIKTLASGMDMFKTAIAVRGYRNGEQHTGWLNATAFGKQAELMTRFFSGGGLACLAGRLELNEYTNKEGQTVKSHNMTVSKMYFMPKSVSGGDNGGQQQQAALAAAPSFDAPAPASNDLEAYAF